MEITQLTPFIIAAYLLGSIPSAVWIGRAFFNIDVRQHGSGNAGATNTLRVLGKPAGIAVLLIDLLKGLAAVSLLHFVDNLMPGSQEFRKYQLFLGLSAVIGHVYPVFARFKGGKGIATLLGMVIGISWPIALLCALVFISTVWLSRYVSLGSMMGAAFSPIFVRFIYGADETFFLYFCLAIAGMVVYTHRANIQRLRAGTESKFSFNKKPEVNTH
ncbi:MAG: glycerol-3-phosphate 1-O-acyltransferase PlsY [Sphingobacteriales bacterium]|jgi:glycerol-3-phosphate acyltransferase PlsY|nr:glycerol-3-phosphate 1-O-acyltransferase PlsY [Sphingobacteriales bacterium]